MRHVCVWNVSETWIFPWKVGRFLVPVLEKDGAFAANVGLWHTILGPLSK